MNKQALIQDMIKSIRQSSDRDIHIMEVCGTHTQAISKLGIRHLVDPNIRLLSGPGCPVCVTTKEYIDSAIELLQHQNVILTTFGDMLKVNGNNENLISQREKGKDIRIVYSPIDAIVLAEENKDKEVIFLAVGFETTAPLVALAIKQAYDNKIKNITFLIGMKRMEPILHHILSDADHHIQGLICPGHVAAVKGEKYFEFIVDKYNIPAVITGFEELDIVGALYFLLEQQKTKNKRFLNLYKSCVTYEGNQKANERMEELFTYGCEGWRGIGKLQNSGFILREKYSSYDATRRFGLKIKKRVSRSCICSDILLGKKLPNECEYFGKTCTPSMPLGPCMISSEGSCSVYYKYMDKRILI